MTAESSARPERRARQEPPEPEHEPGDASGEPVTAVTAILGPAGVLAANVPHYEHRTGQLAMSAAVADALSGDRTLVVEAGTGTGKTLAYLVPALTSGKRVIVSTGTRTLQDQIARRDLPLLRELMPRPFTAVTLKGVSNYVCQRKLFELGGARRQLAFDPAEGRPDAAGGDDDDDDDDDALARIIEWARHTPTGDRAELDALAEDAPIWAAVTNTPDTRLGPRCPFYDSCFVTQARRAAEQADLVLVNHHLFFADLALREAYPGARVLPAYDAVVFDEAHQLEDVITEHFSLRVSMQRLAQLVRDARFALGQRAAAGELFERRTSMDTGERIVAHVERCGARLFAAVADAMYEIRTCGARAWPGEADWPGGADGAVHARAAGDHDAGKLELPRELFADPRRQEAWFGLDSALDDLAGAARALAEDARDAIRDRADPYDDEPGARIDEDRAEMLAAVARRAALFRDDLAAIAEQSAGGAGPASGAAWVDEADPASPQDVAFPGDPAVPDDYADLDASAGASGARRPPADGFVYWVEPTPGRVALCAAPVDVAPVVRRALAEHIPAAVLTSATLMTGGSFEYVRRSLGLDQEIADALAVASPFDFATQAMLYVPRDLPDPREPGFSAAMCDRAAALIAITGGSALVLFTSRRALRQAAARLRPSLPYPVLVQGEAPRATLLERLRDRPGTVLLATGSFWEGVDVPGEALSLVVIDKLPFAPHTDPLIAARMRLAEATGADPFAAYQVPRAALALKQGFGRLIRRGDDRGIAAVLDRRIVTRGYGRAFVRSLPDDLPRTSSLEQLRRWWTGAPR